MSEVTDPSVIAIDQSLFYLRSRLSQRGMQNLGGVHSGSEESCAPDHLDSIPLLYSISNGGDEVTVGAVAEWMCIDPSRASRMVSAAITAGHVTRLASQTDGRRTVLELTAAGQGLLDGMTKYRQTQYERILTAWTPEERAEFARLLRKFGEGFSYSGC